MCTTLFEALIEEQAVEAQKVINEAFGNCKLDNNQIPQALEFIVKILEEIIQEEEENIKKKLPWINFFDLTTESKALAQKWVPEKEVLQEVRDEISIKKDENRVERGEYEIGFRKEKEMLFDCCPYINTAETENYVKTEVRKVNASGSSDKTNIVGSCYKKGIENENDEIIEAERKERSGIKKNEKDDDDNKTILDEEDSEKEKDKVEEFKRIKDFKKTKGPTKKEHAKIEDTAGTSEGRKNGIGVEKKVFKMGKEKRESQTVYIV
ncbi:hypothetical protein C2G38_2226863 [Gigaspora rosea]|uniref:Uncharacterized protein n=1 Tax=Gigaspora rosea TaxID=44941 RepID=A0A397U171_9GLOM|nr:hypothetical protein C2G38_2226863 [Gigaspora rosea]